MCPQLDPRNQDRLWGETLHVASFPMWSHFALVVMEGFWWGPSTSEFRFSLEFHRGCHPSLPTHLAPSVILLVYSVRHVVAGGFRESADRLSEHGEWLPIRQNPS